ncbi:alpha/beta hydrolase [Mycolicibacter virginiensis]|uniref:alpha/beta hydrolase n=1 Tax=Mycolicibacter virginiensis TaxID=1795032 RepID=UPI001F04AF0B|nr:alpha/beta hydrolase [Mycolicibacter virginiensis]ULP46321.1 alpha/beta hydrolase [Mycolicibacter virginiensis]
MTAQPVPPGIPESTAAPRLEILDVGVTTSAHPAPLLFVHGAWHGAWCWAEHFLDFFADKGYRAVAVNLRGHGGSSLHQRLRGCSAGDYVDDVRSVVDDLPTTPVLIGHSMGGYVVQKYLEFSAAPAGVLLASLTSRAGLAMSLRQTRRHPWLMTQFMYTGKSLKLVHSPERAREAFYSATTPESDVVRHAARLQEECQRALLDGMLLKTARPKRITTPLLVLGAEHDGCITFKATRALARACGTDAEIFAGMGHNMMLEPGWDAVAQRIHGWLGERGL